MSVEDFVQFGVSRVLLLLLGDLQFFKLPCCKRFGCPGFGMWHSLSSSSETLRQELDGLGFKV